MLIPLAGARSAFAQEPQPTPPADPLTYTDPGMSFTAPSDAALIKMGPIPVEQLGDDLQTVAQWAVRPGKEDARIIQIQMESYGGPPDAWEGVFESQTHGSSDGTLIRNKQPMTLQNGMPAYYVEVAFGAGFDARKQYAVVWADGARGIVLSYTSRMGDTNEEQAREALKQATAVRYPLYQP